MNSKKFNFAAILLFVGFQTFAQKAQPPVAVADLLNQFEVSGSLESGLKLQPINKINPSYPFTLHIKKTTRTATVDHINTTESIVSIRMKDNITGQTIFSDTRIIDPNQDSLALISDITHSAMMQNQSKSSWWARQPASGKCTIIAGSVTLVLGSYFYYLTKTTGTTLSKAFSTVGLGLMTAGAAVFSTATSLVCGGFWAYDATQPN